MIRRASASDVVYRATIVVEQRNLSDDSLVQRWEAHSKAYNTRSQGASTWLNRAIRDLTETEAKVRAGYLNGTSKATTYETLVDGTGLYYASAWTPKEKK